MLISLNEVQRNKIVEHTLACYPEEMCGILTEEDFIPCKNVSTKPTKAFEFDSAEYAYAFLKAKAVVHSHCRNVREPLIFDVRTPSYKDIVNQKKSGLPWLIFGTEGETVSDPIQIPRVKNNNYLNRRFLWFINDCYSLVQDWYEFELGISLPDHKATEGFENIRCLSDIFTPYISEYGFQEVKLKDIKEGDLVLLDHAGFSSNHLGIYTKGKILHQDLLSVEVPFETFLGRIKKVLSYVN